MSQAQVTEFLGKPTWTGSSGAKGAGDKDVIRWEYKRGRWTYCVDFDYIGPAGSPVVFRTKNYYDEWRWRSWLLRFVQ